MESMDLFEERRKRRELEHAPLAARMRPRSFEEFLGQAHIIGPGKVLREAIEADNTPSLILWGPPGTGKTTLALLIASKTNSHFACISAVSSGVSELRQEVLDSKNRLGLNNQKTLLFIDEIHRFNKAQQDVILPHVENGTVTLVGATTENPSFEVIAPLLSRSRIFTFEPLTVEHIESIVRQALADSERGIGQLTAVLEKQAMEFLVNMAYGDARVALNTLEISARATTPNIDGTRQVSLATIEEALQHRSYSYDKQGDQHYNQISAFIKSVRGSDPDGSLYWLSRMLESGADPQFIARRLVILAAEDVGLAEPSALSIAVSAQQAAHFVGMPEGKIPLAQATVYLAICPKSNSAYVALNKAIQDVKTTGHEPVPLHLRNAPTGLMRDLGYGEGYEYSHDYQDHFVDQEYLPPSLKGSKYYHPAEQGLEKTLVERWRKVISPKISNKFDT